jgi:hypothetical protein
MHAVSWRDLQWHVELTLLILVSKTEMEERYVYHSNRVQRRGSFGIHAEDMHMHS